ncbi:MAG TPA: hypothetical protein VMG41_04530, partial [Gemmatimonadales bacterium]|nr:hypothetical protein [Gemmatimonadales bacterium]
MGTNGRNGFRNRHLLAIDLVLLPAATLLAGTVRFEGLQWPAPYPTVVTSYLLISLPIKIALLLAFGLYRRLWRFASISELESILFATGVSGLISILLGAWLLPVTGALPLRVPLSILVLDALLTGVAVAVPRLFMRSLLWHRWGQQGLGAKRVLIAGAGAAGGMLVKQLENHPQLGLAPIGFVDDDPLKRKHRLHGLPVMGSLSDVTKICRELKVSEVLIAMPNAAGNVVRGVVQA